MTLTEIVEQLEVCGFTCEAGSLEMNEAFIALKEKAAADSEVIEPIELDFTREEIARGITWGII